MFFPYVFHQGIFRSEDLIPWCSVATVKILHMVHVHNMQSLPSTGQLSETLNSVLL